MKKDKVIFRKFDDGDVIALFPKLAWDFQGSITSYMHIGQHGAASKLLITELQPASKEEYADLFAELQSIGYKLEVINGY